jgi:hypothetical protein
MQKSFRLFVLVAALSLTVDSSLYAERAGTNPHPQAVSAPPLTTFQLIAYTVMNYLGL